MQLQIRSMQIDLIEDGDRPGFYWSRNFMFWYNSHKRTLKIRLDKKSVTFLPIEKAAYKII